MKLIRTPEDMESLARHLGVRPDWHEPDEQDVTAQVRGMTFDNAGFWPDPQRSYAELHVVFFQANEAVAAVNLATLCSWASGYRGGS